MSLNAACTNKVNACLNQSVEFEPILGVL